MSCAQDLNIVCPCGLFRDYRLKHIRTKLIGKYDKVMIDSGNNVGFVLCVNRRSVRNISDYANLPGHENKG